MVVFMYRVTNIEGLLEAMKSLQGDKTQAEYAQSMNVSPQYLSDVYKLRRDPGPKILSSLGVTRAYVIPETTCNTAAMRSQENVREKEVSRKGKQKARKCSD